MAKTNNILLALQLAALVEEARNGDPEAQLEAVSEVVDILALKVDYLRNNPEFVALLKAVIAKEVAKNQKPGDGH